MFSNVNEVINHLYLAEIYGYKFKIDWSESCYKSENIVGDPWKYYFDECFPNLPHNIDIKNLQTLPSVFDSKNIITPFIDGVMRLPLDRMVAGKLIEKYVHLRPEIQLKVDDFAQKNFSDFTIGLHIRGPLRTDAGGRKRSRLKQKNGVPFETYFAPVRKMVELHPNSKILICSDSSMVIDETKSNFGKRVFTYGAQRSEKGEMHSTKEVNIDPYILGEDILIECFLLSKTNFFVHGYSNVANFVLCKSPDIQSCFPYGDESASAPSLFSANGLRYRAHVFITHARHKLLAWRF